MESKKRNWWFLSAVLALALGGYLAVTAEVYKYRWTKLKKDYAKQEQKIAAAERYSALGEDALSETRRHYLRINEISGIVDKFVESSYTPSTKQESELVKKLRESENQAREMHDASMQKARDYIARISTIK